MTSRELTSGFDLWSSGYLCMAVMHLHIKFGADIFIQSGLLTIFRNSRWRPPPSWIFSLCEFGHSGVLIVWLVLVLCAKFGSTICYSHSDRRTYASDLHLITSRELTSGFDFWSRGHLCMAVMHLPMKFGADIFIQSGIIDNFPN